MTQEEKQLLLVDLCARLPYGVKFRADNEKCIREIHYIKDENVYIREYRNLSYWVDTIKPYLRPMSSISSLIDAKKWSSLSGIDLIDWYNANYIDYRSLIDQGLALEAPEGMYNFNNNI